MAYPGVTTSQVLDQLAGRLHAESGTDLPSDYQIVAEDALNQAAADIMLILAGKGYTPDQIGGWDYAGTYVLRLAVFYALSDVRVLRNYPALDDKALDPREMLGNLGFLIVDGAPIAPTPGLSPIGGATYGMNLVRNRQVARYNAITRSGDCGCGYPSLPPNLPYC